MKDRLRDIFYEMTGELSPQDQPTIRSIRSSNLFIHSAQLVDKGITISLEGNWIEDENFIALIIIAGCHDIFGPAAADLTKIPGFECKLTANNEFDCQIINLNLNKTTAEPVCELFRAIGMFFTKLGSVHTA